MFDEMRKKLAKLNKGLDKPKILKSKSNKKARVVSFGKGVYAVQVYGTRGWIYGTDYCSRRKAFADYKAFS